MNYPSVNAAEKEISFRGQRQTPTDIGLPECDFTGKSVLDVGCGTGKDLLHPILARAAELCGIDPDEESIRYGCEHYRTLKLSPGRAEKLPYRDGQFDFVLSRVALLYTDLPAALAEISRVLKSGGLFMMTTHDLPHQLRWWAKNALNLEWKRIPEVPYVFVASTLAGLGCHVPAQPWNGVRKTFHSRLLLRRPLRRAGFSNVTFERRARCFIVRAEKH